MKKSKLALARDEFMGSEETKQDIDASTLGNRNPNYYLQNRLERAWIAGVKWGQANQESENQSAPSKGEERTV